MRVLVFGSRTFSDRGFLFSEMDRHHRFAQITHLIEGEATGADTLAKEWAETLQIKVDPYPAKWTIYGPSAGPIRTKQMIDEGNPELCIGFVDKLLKESRGSQNMHDQAQAAGIPVIIYERH